LTFDFVRHNPLESSGTSPNFLIAMALLKSPVAGVTGAAECDRAEVASGGAEAVRTLSHLAAEEFGSTQ
jgi:hypothetical protein